MEDNRKITMETLQVEYGCDGAVLRFGNYVILAYETYTGEFNAKIFTFEEDIEEMKFFAIECGLEFVTEGKCFEDGGSAVQWALGMCK